MSKKTKKQITESLLKRLQLKAKSGIYSLDSSQKFLSSSDNPLSALEIALETLAFYGKDAGLLSLFDEEIKNTMVGSFITKKFYPCTLQIHVNPKLPRELIHFLIDRELDNIPNEILDHYICTKRRTAGLKLKDFLNHLYPNYTEREIKAAKGARERFRTERLRALEVYRLRSLKYDYKRISSAIDIKPDAARKAFARAYELIHGTPYKKGIKLKTSKALLEKDCATCTDKICIKNMKLCPEMDAYSMQDWKKQSEWFSLIPDSRGSAVHAEGRGSREMKKEALKEKEK